MMLQRPCLRRIFIVPTLQRGNGVVTLQRHPDGLVPSPGGVLFFACPKKRTKRKGSPAAETTPVAGLRNRRGKNSLRSDSLPLFPGSAPRRPAQRQRAVFFPGDPSCPEPPSRRGQPSTSRAGIPRGSFPRSSVGLCCRSPTITLNHHRGHGPLLPRDPAPAVGAGRARETHPQKKEKGRQSIPPAPGTPTECSY